MFNPIKWLLEKNQPEEKETIVTDQVAETSPAADTTTPVAEVTAGVKDLKAALDFIETGIAHLGEAAKDELMVLAQKYL